VYCLYFVKLYVILFISSPFLFMLGDDRVILYRGADDATGDATDALGFELGTYLCYYYFIGSWKIVITLLPLLNSFWLVVQIFLKFSCVWE